MSPAELEMHCCDADTVCSITPGGACPNSTSCLSSWLTGQHPYQFRLLLQVSCILIKYCSSCRLNCVCCRWGIWWQHCGCGRRHDQEGHEQQFFWNCGGSALPDFSALTLCTY